MKKTYSKVVKIFALILVTVLGFSNIINVNAAAGSINLGETEAIPALIGKTYFAAMKTTSGQYVYCMDINKTTNRNQTLTLVGERDAGFAYIMQNGYPAKSITGDRISDIYITQTAVWWYLDSTTGSANLSNYFKTSAPDSRGLRGHISALVNGAVAARNQGYKQTSIVFNSTNNVMNLSSDKKYFISNPLSVSSSNIGSYNVTLESAPAGAIVTSTSGVQKNTFGPNEQFLVKVPASSISRVYVSFNVKVRASGTVYRAYEYKPSDTSHQNVIITSPETTNTESNFILEVKTTRLSVLKIDKETGNALAGAEFALKDSKGNIVDKWTSTTSEHIIRYLPYGTYTLEETKAPEGYKKISSVKTITFDIKHRSRTIKIANTLESGYIKVAKVDKETGKMLSGAEFVLKDSNGKVVDKWTSTTSSHLIKKLAYGTYTLEETKAPEGYKKITNPIKITLDKNNRSKVVKVKNTLNTGYIKVIKVDKETGERLVGAKFVLKDSNGKVVDKWTSDKDSHLIKKLAYGTYTLEETEAPEGYKKMTKTIKITIDENNKSKVVKVKNTLNTGYVKIIKVDKNTGNALAGAEFVLKDSKGNIVDKWTSTTSSHLIKKLAYGTYTLEETKAPVGYEKINKSIKITIDENNKSKVVKVKNTAKTTVVTISKIDASTGNLLAGAELVVRDKDGKEIARFTTTENAYVLTDLAYGTYTVEETKAPNGYKLSDSKKTFTIDDDHLTHQINFENYPEVKVPDTSSNASSVMYIIGTVVLSLAAGFIYKNGKKAR